MAYLQVHKCATFVYLINTVSFSMLYTLQLLLIMQRLKYLLVISIYNEPAKYNSPHILQHLQKSMNRSHILFLDIEICSRNNNFTHLLHTFNTVWYTNARFAEFLSLSLVSICTCPGSLYSNILKSPPIWNSCSMRFIGKQRSLIRFLEILKQLLQSFVVYFCLTSLSLLSR